MVAVLAVSVVAFLYLQKQKEADADNIRVSGNIEVTDDELSFKLPGRVSDHLISEGEFAQEGQLVARLDSEELEQEVALREAVLRAAMGLAKTRLNYSKLYSPLSGVALSENVETGEFVSAGTPIVTVGNVEDVWLRAFIDGEDLGRVRLGQEVDLTTDTFYASF